MLEDPKNTVRRGAATALGRIADPKAADALEKCRQDEDDRVRDAAIAALEAIAEAKPRRSPRKSRRRTARRNGAKSTRKRTTSKRAQSK
jgi:hypothetical protein